MVEHHQGTQRRADLEESRPQHDVNSTPIQSTGQGAAFLLLLVPYTIGLGAIWAGKKLAGAASRSLNSALDVVVPSRKKPY